MGPAPFDGVRSTRGSMNCHSRLPMRCRCNRPRMDTVRKCVDVLIILAFVGCAPPSGRVTGTILVDAKPLPSGRVTFLCDGGKRPAISGDISKTGSYEIANIPPGRVRVAVETFKPDPEPPAGINPATGVDSALSKTDPDAYVPIPSRYASPNASGLEFVVNAGEQTFDISLSKP